MDKLKIILDLVRRGHITDEQAEILLRTEKEYVYQPAYRYYYQPYYPGWVSSPYTVTYTGLANSTTLTTSGGCSTTTSCPCGEPGCDGDDGSNQAAA